MMDVVALMKAMKHTPQEGKNSREKRETPDAFKNRVSLCIQRILKEEASGHQLLTPELLERFERQAFLTDEVDPVFVTKFFCPWSRKEWYVCHFDVTSGEFFGFIHDEKPHWGRFNIADLIEHSKRIPDMKVERSINFQEVRSSSMME